MADTLDNVANVVGFRVPYGTARSSLLGDEAQVRELSIS